MVEMKAAVLRTVYGPNKIEDVTLSDPMPDEVLIRTVASGVCHSDLFGHNGGNPALGFPVVLGHEASGVVLAVGSAVVSVVPGDPVVVCPGGSCGACRWCAQGLPQHCIDNGRVRKSGNGVRMTLHEEEVGQFSGLGTFAEQLLVSERSVVKIPADMPLDKAALLGCAVITGIGAVRHTAGVTFGDTVVVIGCGGVGLNAIQAASLSGAARLIAVDRLKPKLDMAALFGATDVINATAVDPVAAVLDMTDGGVDHVIEVVGHPSTIEQAFSMLGPTGTATVVGLSRAGEQVKIPANQLLMEKKLQGSRLGGSRLRLDIPLYAEMYLRGRIKLDELLSHRLALTEIDSALESLGNPIGARSLIEFA